MLINKSSEAKSDSNCLANVYLTHKKDWPIIDTAQLPLALQNRINRYRHKHDRQRSAIAYLICNSLLPNAHYFINPWGRPCLLEGDVNISHSGDLIAVAISATNNPVGIDIEDGSNTPVESHLTAELKQQTVLNWTQQEALIKAIGCGWSFNWDLVSQQKDFLNNGLFTRLVNKDQYFTQSLGRFSGGYVAISLKLDSTDITTPYKSKTFSVTPEKTITPCLGRANLSINPIHLSTN